MFKTGTKVKIVGEYSGIYKNCIGYVVGRIKSSSRVRLDTSTYKKKSFDHTKKEYLDLGLGFPLTENDFILKTYDNPVYFPDYDLIEVKNGKH